MGELRTRNGPSRALLRGIAIACAAALAHPAWAAPSEKSPVSDKAASLAPSAVVLEHRESRGTAIVYHEEKGGLVSTAPAPIPPKPAKAKKR